jgi:hypothetical protein
MFSEAAAQWVGLSHSLSLCIPANSIANDLMKTGGWKEGRKKDRQHPFRLLSRWNFDATVKKSCARDIFAFGLNS